MTGTTSFSAFMDQALYAPGHGFYETGGRAGRRGDFLTSPEVGPLFGAVMARALDTWWRELGRPDPFAVEDHGAGPGTLARSVLRARPACAPALRWTMVERSAAQRSQHQAHLPHVGHLGGPGSDGGTVAWPAPGGGPAVASTADRPGEGAHAVLANELLDNLPFDLFEMADDGWAEVCVAMGPDGGHEAVRPATDDDRSALALLADDVAVGARIPRQRGAATWVADSLSTLVSGGRLVVLDYTATTPALAARPWREWLRTYASHGPGGGPLDHIGGQDITAEVCVDQLARAARPPDVDRDQAAFLRSHGLDELVAEGRATWAERASAADLAALTARSRVGEADALCDPTGLGAFRVLEWQA